MIKKIILVSLILIVALLYINKSVIPETKEISDPSDNIGDSQNSQTSAKKSDSNNLNVLDLSGQKLEKLPSSVLSETSLEELNISNNNITGALPSEIQKLKNLKILNASNNEMTGVPAEVGQLKYLEVLNLSNNELTGLPNELGNLKKLKILNLSGNDYSQQDLDNIKEGLSPEIKIIL